METVFGEDYHVGCWVGTFCAGNGGDDMVDGIVELRGGGDFEELRLNDTDDDAAWCFVETGETAHCGR